MRVTLVCQECGTEYQRVPSAAKNSRFCSNACRAHAMGRVYRRDLTGECFGRWLVLMEVERGPSGDARWWCRCDCGTERAVYATSLVSNQSQSCGCLHREVSKRQAKKNFTKPIKSGAIFERLTVIRREGTKHRQAAYRCLCECGNETVVPSGDLRSGHTKSCGCYNIDRIKERATTHGLSGTPGFSAWRHAVRRESDSEWTPELSDELFEFMPECVLCGETETLTMDHVVPVSKGGRAEPGNVVILCKSCNSKKHDKDLADLPFEQSIMIDYMANLFLEECDGRATWT